MLIPRTTLIKSLDNHSIEWDIHNERLFAAEPFADGSVKWADVTDWSIRKLKEWLGY